MSLRAAVPVTAHYEAWDARDPQDRELHRNVPPFFSAAWTGNPDEGWAATRSLNE